MKYRYLRIAFSVTCGIACVLLVVLWVRSFHAKDSMRGCIAGSKLHMYLSTLKGEIALSFDEWRGNPHPWIFESKSNLENMSSVLPSVTGKPPLSWLGFRWYFKPNLWAIIFPYWFAVLLPASVASLPWLRWQFSLRTLLIATTLVAVVLGLIVYASR
jgi:hypothetical protein